MTKRDEFDGGTGGTLDQIREMYLEKRDKSGKLNATIDGLRYHAQPSHPIHKRFVVCIIYGVD